MAAHLIFRLFSLLHTITATFFAILSLKLLLFVRPFAGPDFTNPRKLHRIITTQYLKLVEQNHPSSSIKTNLSVKQQEQPNCVVCLAEMSEGECVRRLKCEHIFHVGCVDKWLQQSYSPTCPICRTMVLSDEIVASYRQLQDMIKNGGSYEDTISLLSTLYSDHRHLRKILL